MCDCEGTVVATRIRVLQAPSVLETVLHNILLAMCLMNMAGLMFL